MKTKSAAIRHARETIGQLYPFGGSYCYNSFDPSVSAWRESVPRDYWSALASRREALIEAANEFMGHDPRWSAPVDYISGPWTDYVQA